MRSFLLIFFAVSLFIYPQPDSKFFEENGEIYFRFEKTNREQVNFLTRIISIDNVTNDSVFAFASEEEFNEFLKFNIKYEVLTNPGDLIVPIMSEDINGLENWNSYPTYETYVSMMNLYAANYPSICRLVDAGNTVQGRKILFLKISDNVDMREPEPQFMYSSTMHGDEATGFVLMLRLIDSLLTSYGTDQRITNIVNNIELWINPNANPDGTYRTGNHTVSGARRYNANNVDLNRNFPDPADGPHPDGKAWQPETIAMMNLAETNRFVLSANFHGGTEVVNYPWDTWSRLHPDDNWYKLISRLYADTAQAYSPSTYMNGFNNGITNGYAWYRVAGGRQDYFTYFYRGREITVEISDTKLLSASLLPAHWEYNKRSMLNYIEHCLQGIRGIVTDISGNPLKANIKVEGHDFDNSDIFSDSLTGAYFRMIYPGNYNLTFSADNFLQKTINNISVTNFSSTEMNVQLTPEGAVPVELVSFSGSVNGSEVTLEWETGSELNNLGFEIFKKSVDKSQESEWFLIGFVEGNGTTSEKHFYSFKDSDNNSGKYSYRLKQVDFDGTFEYSDEIEINIAPSSFSLEQNYPNPFNPSTKIKYSLGFTPPSHGGVGEAGGGWVTLKIFDILGNHITTLVNEYQSPGEYEIELNGNQLTSGAYIYQLKAGDFLQTKMMMLLK